MGSIPQGKTALPGLATAEKTWATTTDFAAWDTLAVDDKLRFMTGMVQFVGTGQGYMLTQPCERIKWRGLVEAGLVLLDEKDDYIMHLTADGCIALSLILEVYLPVKDMEKIL